MRRRYRYLLARLRDLLLVMLLIALAFILYALLDSWRRGAALWPALLEQQRAGETRPIRQARAYV